MGNMSSLRSCLPLFCLPNDDENDKEEKQQLPGLVVNLRMESNLYSEKRLYNFTTNQLSNFAFRIPFDAETICYSYSHGWLFFLDYNKYALIAFNPFSASIFHLPPFDAHRFRDLKMVTLSADPLLGSKFEVLAASRLHTLAHFESGHGDEFWTYSDGRVSKDFYSSNFIFYKDRLLGAYENFAAAKISLMHLHVVRGGSIKIIKEIASTPKLKDFENNTVLVYLVETTKGDLLMVHRYNDYIEEEEEDREIFKAYRIYKLICHPHEHDDDVGYQLIPIKDLGGDSLFLTECHQSISILASDHPGCRPNSIYYATPEPDNEIEIFNVKDESISKCFIPTGYKRGIIGHLTAWMVPNLKL